MHNPKFRKLIRRVNWYLPYLGMGIRVVSASDDFTRFEVQLRQTWYNRNLFGTHFGGCLYAMCDPFYVFILTMNLGRGYVVWDQLGRHRYHFEADLSNAEGEAVARVSKEVYVRAK